MLLSAEPIPTLLLLTLSCLWFPNVKQNYLEFIYVRNTWWNIANGCHMKFNIPFFWFSLANISTTVYSHIGRRHKDGCNSLPVTLCRVESTVQIMHEEGPHWLFQWNLFVLSSEWQLNGTCNLSGFGFEHLSSTYFNSLAREIETEEENAFCSFLCFC